jgi:hypothetical protein
MLAQSLPHFDALWGCSRPDQSEVRFCEILLQLSEDRPAFLKLPTQLVPAQRRGCRMYSRSNTSLSGWSVEEIWRVSICPKIIPRSFGNGRGIAML